MSFTKELSLVTMFMYFAVAVLLVVNHAKVALPAAIRTLKDRKHVKKAWILILFNLLERKLFMPVDLPFPRQLAILISGPFSFASPDHSGFAFDLSMILISSF